LLDAESVGDAAAAKKRVPIRALSFNFFTNFDIDFLLRK
jgi:hypothetical protein